MTLRIAQLSDPHLLADARGSVRGVPTWDTFRAVLEHAAGEGGGFDHLVLTGDVAEDEARETYEAVAEALAPWRDRLSLIPGNHDDPSAMRELFADRCLAGAPAMRFAFSGAGWRVLGASSHWPGQVAGRIADTELAWLAEELADAGEAPVALFVHHPPVPVGVDWLDAIGFEGPEALAALARDRSQLRLVCCGHVHLTFEGHLGHARVLTAPSTAFQFAPSDPKRFDRQPPGYRIIELDESGWRSRVVRLPRLDHAPSA